MAASDEKQQAGRPESSLVHNQRDMLVEDEPTSIYEIKWRTVLAVIALSLANVCAAIANTVGSPPILCRLSSSQPLRQTQ
jgi:hypothetical protein